MTVPQNHKECCASGCTARPVADRLFCCRHWSLLSPAHRAAIWRAADGPHGRDGPPADGTGDGHGQEIRWYRAVAEAVEHLAVGEGKEVGNTFRTRAMELAGRAGEGKVLRWAPGDISQRWEC